MSKGKWSDDLDSALAEIDSLTTENIRLRELLSYAVEWARDRGYDDTDIAPEWVLSALKEVGDG